MNPSRRTFARFGCLLIAAGLSGCYESASPLSTPGTVPRDAALMGQWRCEEDGAKSNERTRLQVFPFDEAQYYAELTDNRETARYRAYGSRVGDVTLLNVLELKAGLPAGKWMFVRYRIESPRTLKLALVNAESVKGLPEADALQAIRQRAADDALYEPWTTCSREER